MSLQFLHPTVLSKFDNSRNGGVQNPRSAVMFPTIVSKTPANSLGRGGRVDIVRMAVDIPIEYSVQLLILHPHVPHALSFCFFFLRLEARIRK